MKNIEHGEKSRYFREIEDFLFKYTKTVQYTAKAVMDFTFCQDILMTVNEIEVDENRFGLLDSPDSKFYLETHDFL